MANQKITQLTALTNSNVDVLDVLPIVDVSAGATDKITYQNLMRPKDSVFGIVDDGDITKIVAFQISGLTTATTRTITVPDSDLTLVGLTTSQTLTNKTLTSPQINMSSNATGDMYYRDGSGVFQRLPIGTSGQIISASSGGIPEWIANPSASDASTTVKGVVEEATLAETLARTATGGTSARLFVNPTNLTTVQTYDYVVDTGSGTAYAIAPTPAITAYVAGQTFTFKAVNANTSTTPTVAVSGLTAKTITNTDGTALFVGQITANSIVRVTYDGTNMVIDSASKVDFNSVPNTQGTAQTYFTYIATPQDTGAGWTTPNGTATGAVNGITMSAAATNQIRGEFDDVAGSAVGLNHYTALKLSYNVIFSKTSVGVTPFGGANVWYFSGMSEASNIADAPDITSVIRRVGFAHYNGRIYTITADNSTVTATNIQADSSASRIYTIDYTSTSVKFYINGALVATHTTSIISDGTATYFWALNRDAGTSTFRLSPITISVKYAT